MRFRYQRELANRRNTEAESFVRELTKTSSVVSESGQLAGLTEAGRLWIEVIDKLASMDEHTPERRATRNLMLSRIDELETVFRRILGPEGK